MSIISSLKNKIIKHYAKELSFKNVQLFHKKTFLTSFFVTKKINQDRVTHKITIASTWLPTTDETSLTTFQLRIQLRIQFRIQEMSVRNNTK